VSVADGLARGHVSEGLAGQAKASTPQNSTSCANPSSRRNSPGAESVQSQGKTGQLTGRRPQNRAPKLVSVQLVWGT
jgi:hypothetical protein